MRSRFAKGQHNVICDICGFKVKSGSTRMTWNNLRVCTRHWEPRQQQDFVRGRSDRQTVPNPRPEPTADYLATNEVTVDNL